VYVYVLGYLIITVTITPHTPVDLLYAFERNDTDIFGMMVYFIMCKCKVT